MTARTGQPPTNRPRASQPECSNGRSVDLPAGRVYARDFPGPAGAPTVVLLHGWMATSDINFYRCYAPLARRFRVISLDHRGHGRGIRSVRPVRLADCADDAVALADELDIDRFIPVGYSLGGAVAQLVARRHPGRVAGAVFCCTAARFGGEPVDRLGFAGLSGLAAAARLTPEPLRRRLVARYFEQRKQGDWSPWAIEAATAHDWRMVLEAGAALGTFSSTTWISQLDMPAAVVITEADQVVAPARQHELADLLEHATVFPVAAGHDAAVSAPGLFIPALLAAIDSVVHRARPDHQDGARNRANTW